MNRTLIGITNDNLQKYWLKGEANEFYEKFELKSVVVALRGVVEQVVLCVYPWVYMRNKYLGIK